MGLSLWDIIFGNKSAQDAVWEEATKNVCGGASSCQDVYHNILDPLIETNNPHIISGKDLAGKAYTDCVTVGFKQYCEAPKEEPEKDPEACPL